MSEKTAKPSLNGAVTKKQLEALSANFFSRIQILENGTHRPISCADPKHAQKNDTRSVHFDKARIDELFANNPGSDGLKIYFGIHDHEIYPLPEDVRKQYQNKLMVVLVATTAGKDNLKEAESPAADSASLLSVTDNGGTGVDSGRLCPPNLNC